MTESRQEEILRKVRGLIAKAQSTEFEAERDAFMAKADALMEAYAIEEYMLHTGADESKARLVKRRDMDASWWRQLYGIDYDAKNCVWWLYNGCVSHCRCTTSVQAWSFTNNTIAVYGLEADLNYLDLLFTDLFMQLFSKIRPAYDPNKSMGENVMRAKETGVKYTDIAVWLGHPEWRVPNNTGGYKTADKGKMKREYEAYLSSVGRRNERISVNPKAYQYSYCYAFYAKVTERLREMRGERATEHTGSMALALRDIQQLAKEAMWEDFPELKPHPEDCKCEQCSAKRKPIKYRQGYQLVPQGYGAGRSAGESARIVTQQEGLKGRNKSIES